MSEQYDYIIVGAGSAGCVLAARLSSDPRTTVLLLESGPDLVTADEPDAMRDRNPFVLLGGSKFSGYRYDDIPARRVATQELRPYPRGRGVGGSSIIHGHVYVRGEVPADYDLWARQGCEGWGGKDVLPVFVALEDDLDFGDQPYHGQDGSVTVQRSPRREWSDLDAAFCEAALDQGHPWAEDIAAPGSTGLSPMPHALRENRRISASASFLEPVRHRRNLHVRADALVERVEISSNRAVGVVVDGELLGAEEIVVSAGTAHSPAVLMRSGIGPADQLQALDIEVIRDAPVGKNLLDHALIWLGVRTEAPTSDGATPGLVNLGLRYSSGLAGAGENDIMISPANLPPSTGLDGFLGVQVWQQFSRGQLTLDSADPSSRPLMELNMLSDERDLSRLRDAVRRLWGLREHPAIADIVHEVVTHPFGETVSHLPSDDDELDAWLRDNCQESAHASGTCRMGAVGDPRSVVDSNCRVIGIENLRVIDGSVLPEIPRANTYCPTLMVAEMMARRLVAH